MKRLGKEKAIGSGDNGGGTVTLDKEPEEQMPGLGERGNRDWMCVMYRLGLV